LEASVDSRSASGRPAGLARRSVTRLSALSSVAPATGLPRPANMNFRVFAFANAFWAPLATRVHLGVHRTLGTRSWTPCAARIGEARSNTRG
jgi:hypothetical protein